MNRFFAVLAASVLSIWARADERLPIFLADNHAETFGWISRTFDPDSRHQLVLIDAHSDASTAERSEEIREGLRRVPTREARAARVGVWRQSGRIQAFNWIEPLMPRPLEQVTWFAPTPTTEMHAGAVELLDGRLEVEPRSAGSLAGRWETHSLAEFDTWKPGTRPVILAIDLDFFAGMEPSRREADFEKIWQRAMDWPGLAGVAFAVSRPWLKDDAEADALVRLACEAVSRTHGALLEVDASLDDRPDDSKLARGSQKIPRWDAEQISHPVRECLLAIRDRLRMTDRKRDWRPIFGAWERAGERLIIRPEVGEMDCDGVWRFSTQSPPVLRIDPLGSATGRVRWFALEPARAAYDLLPRTGLGKGFSVSPGRWIYEKRRALGMTGDFALPATGWFPGNACRVRVAAEVETASGWIPAPCIELRLADRSGFRGALSECFGMPYVFGIAGVREGDLSGVESGWGSDCANFLIHAWRRNSMPLAWGDPGRLRAQLVTKADAVTLADVVSIDEAEVERGIAIDFGKHVAALWEDREPLGKLGGNDLVAHHLGGFPEVVELSTLTRDRSSFSLRAPRQDSAACEIKVAGDVVLAGEDRAVIDGFEKGNAALLLANLEGVPSRQMPDEAQRYDFRFPPERLTWLRKRGVDVVSLANNHAGDAGRDGLIESLEALRAAGIAAVGVGRNTEDACKPWRTVVNGVRIAVFGICEISTIVADDVRAGVAKLPEHADVLEIEIRRAKSAGEVVIVMIHGGDEYREQVNDEQRRWARWLVNCGVNLIVGAHPHVTQRTEYHGGAVIVHSLGNAVYPASLKGADSGELRTFQLTGDGVIR